MRGPAKHKQHTSAACGLHRLACTEQVFSSERHAVTHCAGQQGARTYVLMKTGQFSNLSKSAHRQAAHCRGRRRQAGCRRGRPRSGPACVAATEHHHRAVQKQLTTSQPHKVATPASGIILFVGGLCMLGGPATAAVSADHNPTPDFRSPHLGGEALDEGADAAQTAKATQVQACRSPCTGEATGHEAAPNQQLLSDAPLAWQAALRVSAHGMKCRWRHARAAEHHQLLRARRHL